MAVAMWHPETGGTFEAPDDAVAHYRQSGWLRLDEREEHETRLAEREKAIAKIAAKTAKGTEEK